MRLTIHPLTLHRRRWNGQHFHLGDYLDPFMPLHDGLDLKPHDGLKAREGREGCGMNEHFAGEEGLIGKRLDRC